MVEVPQKFVIVFRWDTTFIDQVGHTSNSGNIRLTFSWLAVRKSDIPAEWVPNQESATLWLTSTLNWR